MPVTAKPKAMLPEAVMRVNVMVNINVKIDDPVRLNVLAKR
jgi:hypothetical protein